jgi:chromosomal replication initiation ATPase DnaA
MYVTAEQLFNEYRRPKWDRFFSADVLLIDNVEIVAENEQKQEELFELLDELHVSRQIVLAADRPSKGVKECLVDRFYWGFSTAMESHDPMLVLENQIKELRVQWLRMSDKEGV